jgi:hypothetical protein
VALAVRRTHGKQLTAFGRLYSTIALKQSVLDLIGSSFIDLQFDGFFK